MGPYRKSRLSLLLFISAIITLSRRASDGGRTRRDRVTGEARRTRAPLRGVGRVGRAREQVMPRGARRQRIEVEAASGLCSVRRASARMTAQPRKTRSDKGPAGRHPEDRCRLAPVGERPARPEHTIRRAPTDTDRRLRHSYRRDRACRGRAPHKCRRGTGIEPQMVSASTLKRRATKRRARASEMPKAL